MQTQTPLRLFSQTKAIVLWAAGVSMLACTGLFNTTTRDNTSTCPATDSNPAHSTWTLCGSCANSGTCGYCPPGTCPANPCSTTCSGAGGSSSIGDGAGLLANAIFYTGGYPATTSVSFTARDGTAATVDAYPGQVQVFVDPTTSQSLATQSIVSAGGAVLAQIPLLGFYFASVAPGTESAFISAIRSASGVRDASPNTETTPAQGAVPLDTSWLTNQPVPRILGPGQGIIVDSGFGPHAGAVAGAMTGAGGTVSDVLAGNAANGTLPGEQVAEMVAWAAASRQVFNPGDPIFINVSIGGGDPSCNWGAGCGGGPANITQNQQNWLGFMQNLLPVLVAMPPDVQDHLVLTGALGNGGTDLTMQLQALRMNDAFAMFLDQHVLLDESDDVLPAAYLQAHRLTAQRPGGLYSNTARDPCVVRASGLLYDGSGNIIGYGTSFGAPRINAIAQQVLGQVPGLTAQQIVAAIRQAAMNNPMHLVVLSEAVAAALAIQQAAGGGGTGGGSSSGSGSAATPSGSGLCTTNSDCTSAAICGTNPGAPNNGGICDLGGDSLCHCCQELCGYNPQTGVTSGCMCVPSCSSNSDCVQIAFPSCVQGVCVSMGGLPP